MIRFLLAAAATLMLLAVATADAADCRSEFFFAGEAAADCFGSAVAGGVDVNDDGRPDIIVGAPYRSSGGGVYVYSGLDGSALYQFDGENPGDAFGWSVAAAGDVDHDGRGDILVGAIGYADSTGRAYVFSGATGARLLTFDGTQEKDRMGFAVAGMNDLNGDGYGDIAVSAVGYDYQGSGRGAVFVISGKDTSQIHFLPGAVDIEYGYSIAAAGDANNDGFTDLIVGQPSYSGGMGLVHVYSGQTGGYMATYWGQRAGDGMGWSVAAMGDVDKDGHDDVVVGAPFYDG